MDTVFLAFANSTTEKLETLTEEDEKVNAVLSKRKVAGDIDLIREQYATTNRIMDSLFMYQHKITVFLYSGHAGRDRLVLEDQDANAEGITAILQQCPNLKLVGIGNESILGRCNKESGNAGKPVTSSGSAVVFKTDVMRESFFIYRTEN